MAKHTPGPWQERDGGIYGKDNTYVAHVYIKADQDKSHANARLIANAPALLEALQRLVAEFESAFDESDSGWSAVVNAHTVMQMATGNADV